jgi:UDP-N-acetylmuramoylalanine--D-glutamate ligase
MTLRGVHNVQNVLASLAAGLACGASPDSMRETLRSFQAVEHRLEFVAEIEGVKFYNDSKATSVDASAKALEALSEEAGKTVLILGGRGKNAPYQPLADLIKRTVRRLILIGEDADNIESQLKDFAEIVRADSMPDAVKKSFAAALEKDSVLLAPACASFDMFNSFEERGKEFKSEVLSLESEVGSKTDSRLQTQDSRL